MISMIKGVGGATSTTVSDHLSTLSDVEKRPISEMVDDRLLDELPAARDAAGGLRLTDAGSVFGELAKAVPERAPEAGPASGIEPVPQRGLLPRPPTDEEKYSYARRHLWVLTLLSLGCFACLAVSQCRFTASSPWLWLFAPFLALIALDPLISFWLDSFTRDFDLRAHRRLVRAWQPTRYPSVDIFLPVCGEPIEILHNTWQHVQVLMGHYSGAVLCGGRRPRVRATSIPGGLSMSTGSPVKAQHLAALLTACGLFSGTTDWTFSSSGRNEYNLDSGTYLATGRSSPSTQDLPYDIRPLLKPRNKYFGVAVDGAPDSRKPVKDFAAMVGKQPNIIEFYSKWGDAFDLAGVDKAWRQGGLPYMAWEPTTSITAIAEGRTDRYIRDMATRIRTANIPIAISFGHEMNGDWTPWGIKHFSPADFVKAWRHVHDVFERVGATMVIWVWSPNQTNFAKAPLEPLWPGDGYVDWIGVIGYYDQGDIHTFTELFDPTLKEVRAFTNKPVIIAETAAPPGPRKPADIADLFSTVASRSDVIGLIWFNFNKPGKHEHDYRVNSSPEAKAAFRRFAADSHFGFDIRKPQ